MTKVFIIPSRAFLPFKLCTCPDKEVVHSELPTQAWPAPNEAPGSTIAPEETATASTAKKEKFAKGMTIIST